MSLTPQQQQEIVDEVEVGGRPEDPYAGPSSAIDVELQSLGPGDHVRLASLLRQYPDKQDYILSVAVTRCGNGTVQRALQMNRDNADQYAAKSDELNADVRDVDAMPSHPAGVGTVDQQTKDDATAVVWDDTTTKREIAANKYNDAHPQFVSDFNDATNGSTLLNGGVVDIDAVVAWQQAHGLVPDGKIGPQTVAAAKKAASASKANDEEPAPTPTEDDADDDVDPAYVPS